MQKNAVRGMPIRGEVPSDVAEFVLDNGTDFFDNTPGHSETIARVLMKKSNDL